LFPYPGYSNFALDMSRDSIVVAETTGANRQHWQIGVETDATVTVALTIKVDAMAGQLLAHAVVEDALRPALVTAAALAREAGAFGRAYVVISIVGIDFELFDDHGHHGQVPELPNLVVLPTGTGASDYLDGIEAWIELESDLADELIAGMERQLLRSCGITVWEPESTDAASRQPPPDT